MYAHCSRRCSSPDWFVSSEWRYAERIAKRRIWFAFFVVQEREFLNCECIISANLLFAGNELSSGVRFFFFVFTILFTSMEGFERCIVYHIRVYTKSYVISALTTALSSVALQNQRTNYGKQNNVCFFSLSAFLFFACGQIYCVYVHVSITRNIEDNAHSTWSDLTFQLIL